MKYTFRGRKILIFILLFPIFFSCQKAKNPNSTVLTTVIVTGITQAGAVSGGNITSDGGSSITTRGVCWSTNQNPTILDSKTSDGVGSGTFSSNLSDLTANTTYNVRAYATNAIGTVYGNELTFKTSQIVVAIVTTTAVSSIMSNSAASGGNVTDNGGGLITSRGVCWGTTTNPTSTTNKTTDGTGTGSFTSQITGLIAGTTYYVRAYATNNAGISYGDNLMFSTTADIPIVTTSAITSITQTTAASGGDVTATGGATVTAKGVCWGIITSPTIADSHTSDGIGTGSFTSQITGLIAGTKYYVRAYATNSAGTTYGNQLIFTALNAFVTVTDIEGTLYNTVSIGTQVWMSQNLTTTKYNDNIDIPYVTDNTAWLNLTTPGYCLYTGDPYESNPIGYKNIYGVLYNWYTVNTSKLCPIGWHVPTKNDWEILVNYLGGASIAGSKMKEAGFDHWGIFNTDATNESGLTALPGGCREEHGYYNFALSAGFFWSSTQATNDTQAYFQYMERSMKSIKTQAYYYSSSDNSKKFGFSVRCLKDNLPRF